jgi:hypothetical protein
MNSLAFSLILLSLPLIYGQNDKQILEYVVKQYTKLVKNVETGIEYPTYDVLSAVTTCVEIYGFEVYCLKRKIEPYFTF